ncbi:hypothetical protein JEZ95_18240 [Enterobacter hormaechei]|nr:hypothetical protein [Enterobacter hormaechei]
MSVKRYEWMACDEHACHCDVVESAEGDMVDYEDYAALEARCAALAAENANCRNAVQVFCDVVDANTDAICEEVGQDGVKAILAAMSATGNMPATDAFLAEVRAQGVEMFAAVLRCKGDDAFFDAIAEAQANAADQFAAQIRKGVQS